MSKEAPHSFLALCLACLLTSLSIVVFLWGRAGVAPPCGMGLGCALDEVQFGNLVFQPSKLALVGLVLPWALCLPERLIEGRKFLVAALWGQAVLAFALQIFTLSKVGSVCPYCLGITILYFLAAAAATWQVPERATIRSASLVFFVAIGSSAFAAYHASLIQSARSRPLDLASLNRLASLPEAVVFPPDTKGMPDWLAVIDPSCPSCDATLKALALRHEEGSSVGILLSDDGANKVGLVLLKALRDSSSPTDAMRNWPKLRTETAFPDASFSPFLPLLERQVLRSRSLGVITSPILLPRVAGQYVLDTAPVR